MMAASTASRPVIAASVGEVELSRPLSDLSALDDRGRPAERAWLLVRLFTEPIGTLLVDLPDEGLPADDLADLVEDEFGARVRVRAAAAGAPIKPFDGTGVVSSWTPPYLRERERILADAPPMTVVICTRENPVPLRRALASVLACRYPDFRVLVVDNAPTSDRTADVVREASARGPVEYAMEPRPGLSNARNHALEMVGDEVVAWTDDDAVVDPFWLAEIARGLDSHPEADVVCGPMLPAELETRAQLWFEEFGGHSRGRGLAPFVFGPATARLQSPLYPLPPFGTGANMAWRAGSARGIGGFDPALGAGTPAMGSEDTLAFTRILRAGGTIVYQPSAVIKHFHHRSFDELERRMAGYGTGLTAAYTALVRSDPLVLPALLRLVPMAVRDVFSSWGRRTATTGPDFPADVRTASLRGMLRGPWAYFQGRRRNRRWRGARR
jgi:glycosyltransferase involved in cell wall biosynthesis